MTNKEPMTQQRREAFWRTYGWTPDLPEAERRKIEEYWTDPEIEEAQHLGFRSATAPSNPLPSTT
ncbi:hypothetical protein Rruber_05465 (plasmid) [Rhodococcus ruber]